MRFETWFEKPHCTQYQSTPYPMQIHCRWWRFTASQPALHATACAACSRDSSWISFWVFTNTISSCTCHMFQYWVQTKSCLPISRYCVSSRVLAASLTVPSSLLIFLSTYACTEFFNEFDCISLHDVSARQESIHQPVEDPGERGSRLQEGRDTCGYLRWSRPTRKRVLGPDSVVLQGTESACFWQSSDRRLSYLLCLRAIGIEAVRSISQRDVTVMTGL